MGCDIFMLILFTYTWIRYGINMLPLILPLYSVTAETLRIVRISTVIHCAFCIFVHPAAFPLSAGLRAAGDARFTMWAAIVSTVVFRTFFSFLFGLWLRMGVVGIALAMVLDWCIKGTLDLKRWKGGKWKRFRVI